MSRVLVVEDEQHLSEGLRFNLEAEGYEVEVVKPVRRRSKNCPGARIRRGGARRDAARQEWI